MKNVALVITGIFSLLCAYALVTALTGPGPVQTAALLPPVLILVCSFAIAGWITKQEKEPKAPAASLRHREA